MQVTLAPGTATFTCAAQPSGDACAKGSLASRRGYSEEMLPGQTTMRYYPLFHNETRSAAAAEPESTLAQVLAGTGPWRWAGNIGLGFLRYGELLTPWGEVRPLFTSVRAARTYLRLCAQGKWGVTRDGETAPPNAIFADFAGSQHTLRATSAQCLKLGSTRKTDGEKVGIDFGPGALNAPAAARSSGCRAELEGLVKVLKTGY